MNSVIVDTGVSLDQVPVVITKYELTRAVGLRAQMLQQGARPNSLNTRHIDALANASQEVRERSLSFALCRELQCEEQYVQFPSSENAHSFA